MMDIQDALQQFRRNGDIEGADRMLRDWVKHSNIPSDTWLAIYSLAVFAVDEFRFKEALSYCSELLEIDDNDAGVHRLRSIALSYAGYLDEAEKEINTAIHLAQIQNDLNLYDYKTDLCYVLLKQHKYDECEQLALDNLPSTQKEIERIGYLPSIRRLILLAKLCRLKGNQDMWAEYIRHANRIMYHSGKCIPLRDLFTE